MIVTLCYWTILFGAFFGVGWAGRRMAHWVWKQDVIQTWDGILMTGVVLSTLYAETVSIFFPLGAGAALVLLGLSTASILVWHGDMGRFWGDACARTGWKQCLLQGAMLLLFIVLAALWTCFDLCDFDNLNYHAQSIRWLEEYGVVKGLGNLHTRLAYNSAFFPLQALFSFSWVVDRSLHSLNGFLWVFAMCFCSYGRKQKKGCFGALHEHLCAMPLSSVFRVLLCFVTVRRGLAGGTPTADFLPLFLTGYIFVKWCELNENDAEDIIPYVFLAFLAIWSTTVKLSAAMLGCFCLKPLIVISRRRDWKNAIGFFVICGLILAPFFVRNVLLSGWLVYPFPWLDLFAMDWKIPSLVSVSDAAAIRGYALFGDAWDWSYEYLKNSPITWLVQWFGGIPFWGRIVVVINVVFYLLMGVCFVWLPRKCRKSQYDGVIWGTAFAGFAYMMLTAPSLRFGIWWMFVGVAMTYWMLANWLGIQLLGKMDKTRCLMKGAFHALCLIYVVIALKNLCGVASRREGGLKSHVVYPCDYVDTGSTVAWMDVGGQRFYYRERTPTGPREGGMNGYHGFPGTEYRTTLELIELRDGNIAGGFPRRKDTQCLGIDFRGQMLDGQDLALLGWTP